MCACVRASVHHACSILGPKHARVLKFHIWSHHKKLADPCFFFFSELSPLLDLCPFGEDHYESLSVRYLKKCLSKGLETESAYQQC